VDDGASGTPKIGFEYFSMNGRQGETLKLRYAYYDPEGPKCQNCPTVRKTYPVRDERNGSPGWSETEPREENVESPQSAEAFLKMKLDGFGRKDPIMKNEDGEIN